MAEIARATKSESVRQHIVHLIDAGLQPHDRLPTERELADEFAYSRLTVRRALDQLEHDGIVYRVQGAGTFVSDTRIAKSFELTSFSEDMRARGMTPGSQSAHVEVRPAGMKVGYALGLSPMEPVVHISRVRTADGIPICSEDCYLPERLAPGLSEEDVAGSLYEILTSQYGVEIERADQVIAVTVLEPAHAEQLQVPAFSPAFHIVRTSRDGTGRAVEYAESVYRGDRYSYELTVLRRREASGPA